MYWYVNLGHTTSHTYPQLVDDGWCTLAQEIFEFISETVLCKKLTIIGTDGTASMTSKFNGAMRSLKQLLKNPLQWSICLLYTNEFPLRHVFLELDSTINSPDSFTGPIGKQLDERFSEFPISNFKNIFNMHFLIYHA